MKRWRSFLSLLLLLLSTVASAQQASLYPTTKPLTRWWWFATRITEEDVRDQLDWFKRNNFGGVEIAWVYPLYRYRDMYAKNYGRYYPRDTTAQKWLSTEWSDIVAFTGRYARQLGLACDFTFGSAWPVAGPDIDRAHRTMIYGDTAFVQPLTFAWTWPDTQWVINHLDSNAFRLFADPIRKALRPALAAGGATAMFTDSWEIKLNARQKIWTPGFARTFLEAFGYDILPYMEAGLDSFPDVRYDYMLHLHGYVLEGFYKPFVRTCHAMNTSARVQCLASPTDVMTTYALVDIPESEALLNDPPYSRIVSSAAALSGKPMVSSETFTCLYGFPATYLRREQTADLKMVADALFAEGVNQHVYHGSPYRPKGVDSIDFFATTYFGPGGQLEGELPRFNTYIEKVSGHLQAGRTYTDVAIYIPYEDAVMKGAYPKERQRVWVWGEYELRYISPPPEAEGYHPLWINRHFLDQASWQDGRLRVGEASFSLLYVDVAYMDVRALRRILALAREGLPVCLKRLPQEPGLIKSGEYSELLDALLALPQVSPDFPSIIGHPPLISGDSIPAYWCRVLPDGTHYLFLAQPRAKGIGYPICSGQSLMRKPSIRNIELFIDGRQIRRRCIFRPYQSLLLKVDPKGRVRPVNIKFTPKDPEVWPREPQRTYF